MVMSAETPMEPYSGRIERAHRQRLEALAEELNAARADGRADWTWSELLRITSESGIASVRRKYLKN